MAEKVIFESEDGWAGRYRVETKETEGYWESSWYPDRTYDKPESAIARAENLIYKRNSFGKEGIRVRVIDTVSDDEEATEEE